MNQGKVLVVGLGLSGLEVCRALKGERVVATDIKLETQFDGKVIEELRRLNCELILGSHDVGDVRSFKQIILSPGVPPDLPFIVEAKDSGVEVLSELEWAWRQLKCPTVAITGTNGKTTTTELIGEIFRRSGSNVFVGGNIGTPLTRAISDKQDWDIAVVEVSSFQLDMSPHFQPDTAVLLNIEEDHLDRYSSFEEYVYSKISIIHKARAKSKKAFIVLNGDDPNILKHFQPDDFTYRWSRVDPKAEAYISSSTINVAIEKPRRIEALFTFPEDKVLGAHNLENMAAAALVGLLWNIPERVIWDVFSHFRPSSHRLQWLGTFNGVSFYDDSKATNVAATIRALESFDNNVWLLLGGKDKKLSFDKLKNVVNEKCKGVVVFGEVKERLFNSLNGVVENVFKAEDLEEAFSIIISRVKKGDIVLLSPACSSFDQYTNYRERGLHFQRLVRNVLRQ